MIISIMLIAILLFLIRIFKVRLMEPAGMYCAMWLIFISGSILTLNEYEFSYNGIIWILITCYITVAVSCLFRVKFKIDRSAVRRVYLPLIPWKILAGFVVLGMCSVVYTMMTSGVSLSVFSSFSSLQNTAHVVSVNRYAGNGEQGSLMAQILGSFIYISPLCAGYSIILADDVKKKIICISSIFPALFSMLLTSAKLGVVTFVILYFIGLYTSYIYNKKCLPKINIKIIIYVIIGIVVLYELFYLSFVLRIGKSEDNLVKVIKDKLMIYAFGHVQGFDMWFDRYAFNIEKYGVWKHTFLAISSKMGLVEKNQGIYGFMAGTCTNVYTQFRGLIEDIGPILSLLVIFLIFVLIYYLFFKAQYGRKKYVISQVILTAELFWIVYFIVSAWTYTTYIITFLVFAVFIYISFNVKFIWRENEKNKDYNKKR